MWRSFLADPEKQWKKGYSAYELAHSCEGLPSSIRGVFSNTEFENMKILYVFPEHQVYLDNQKAPSQNDLLCKADRDLVVVMVEGKVEEPFGELVKDWHCERATARERDSLFLEKPCLEGFRKFGFHSISVASSYRFGLVGSYESECQEGNHAGSLFSPSVYSGCKAKLTNSPSVRIHEVELSFAWVSEKANNSPL